MEPQSLISDKALTAWKFSGLIGCSIIWVLSLVILVLADHSRVDLLDLERCLSSLSFNVT